MAYENRNGSSRGGPHGGPRRDQPREFFTATCVDCGKECEIPFRPTQGRPVYCRDCYRNHKPAEHRPRKPMY